MLCLPPQPSIEWSSVPWASIWEVQEDVLSFSSWPWHFESLAQLESHRSNNLFTPQGRSVWSLAPGLFKSCIFIIFRLKGALFRLANMTIWLRKQLDSHQLRSGPRPRSLHGPDCQLPLSILLSRLGSTRQNEHQPFIPINHSPVEWVTGCVLVEETPLPFRPFWFEKPQQGPWTSCAEVKQRVCKIRWIIVD